jgi:hypothetical protein
MTHQGQHRPMPAVHPLGQKTEVEPRPAVVRYKRGHSQPKRLDQICGYE